jgi:hypothetical protein
VEGKLSEVLKKLGRPVEANQAVVLVLADLNFPQMQPPIPHLLKATSEAVEAVAALGSGMTGERMGRKSVARKGS